MTTPRRLLLSEIADRLEADRLLVQGSERDVELGGIADDSRLVRPGELFCAWSGTSSDAHDFAGLAEAAGAAALLVERRVRGVAVPQLVARNGRRGAAVAASAFYGDPQAELRLVGVTGTNGKTTTVWLLRHLLSVLAPTASLGTLGTMLADGSVLPGSEALTTPGPVELARVLRLLVDRGVRAAALEVSSHALDQGRVHTLRFDAALFTNLSRDHLDYHGTLETYLGAKRSLVRWLRDDGWAVVNADDAAWAGLTEDAPRALTFGMTPAADITATGTRVDADGVSFQLRTPDGAVDVTLPLLGAFNVQNALAAASACVALGMDPAAIAEAMRTVPQVPGRLERIASRPCAVLCDYAHTPDALGRVLEALRPLTSGRVIAVFGAGGDRDRGKRPLMGAVAEQLADVVIVTSDNPRTEDPDTIIDEIEAGMSGTRHARIVDRRAAIAHALGVARTGDIVLLAGKGHETYQIIGTEKHPFDERQIVAELGAAGEVTQ
jgi:UDP-N-acetylmuramoyl-L-alanyl-D-glutamate--2,6-diaminopimelate ligase